MSNVKLFIVKFIHAVVVVCVCTTHTQTVMKHFLPKKKTAFHIIEPSPVHSFVVVTRCSVPCTLCLSDLLPYMVWRVRAKLLSLLYISVNTKCSAFESVHVGSRC